jgi:hypothetical protein
VTVSQPKSVDLSTGLPAQKPRTNVYTMMLLLSFVAIIVAVVVLWAALGEYGDFPQWETGTSSWLAPTPAAPPSLPA